MQRLTKEQEERKMEALLAIGSITSIRNPNRIEDIEEILRLYGEKAKKIDKVGTSFLPLK